MQNRGTIGFFTVLLILAALYLLSFSYFTDKFEASAKQMVAAQFEVDNPGENAADNVEKVETLTRAYLREKGDSAIYPVFGKTYDELKAKQLNLGLDLQGGMSVTLEVSIPDLLISWSDNNTSVPEFREAITEAKALQNESGSDFITLFGQTWSTKNSSTPLWRIFNNYEVQDKFSENVSDAVTLDELKTEANDAIDNTENIVRKRIDKFGVAQPNITQEESTKRIIVELPGVKDKESVRDRLKSVAKLEFWNTYFSQEIAQQFVSADEALGKSLYPDAFTRLEEKQKELEADTTDVETPDTPEDDLNLDDTDLTDDEGLNLDDEIADAEDEVDEELIELSRQLNPIRSLMLPTGGGGSNIGGFKVADTSTVNKYLNNPVFVNALPADLKLMWEYNETSSELEDGTTLKYVGLYAIKGENGSDKAPLDGSCITDANADLNPTTNRPELNMAMNSAGSSIWYEMTKAASADNNRQLAIVLDRQVLSAPNSQDPISDGRTRVTFGSETGATALKRAKELAGILEAGSLPAPANIVNENTVGPSIGQANIEAGKLSFIIALLVILIYMIFYYQGAGLISNVALIVNMVILIGALISIGGVLTLPGIAGIVLTIGMAVDANVLIYERVREELRNGKGLALAVKDGYKAAYSAIIDANVTTMLTALILFSFGSGPIKGFATTLIIGILTSLFSAIIITRLIIFKRLENKKSVSFSSNITKNWFTNMNFQFVKNRKKAYILSGLIIAAGLVGLFTKGLDKGVDFDGGYTYEIYFDEEIERSAVAGALEDAFMDNGDKVNSKVQTIGGTGKVYKITTKYMINSDDQEADNIVRNALFAGLEKTNVNFDKENLAFSKVKGSISDDFRRGAIIATILSLIVIFLYIFLRFRKMQYSIGALLAMVHDVLIVLGLFALLRGIVPFSLEIDQAFIAAILTVIGYSINDTVVVFDRIREYLGIKKNKSRNMIINDALNSTLSRTINTSLSTFVVLLMIFIIGGDEIKGFTFALMIGVVVGTYSSLFIATPAVIDLSKDGGEE